MLQPFVNYRSVFVVLSPPPLPPFYWHAQTTTRNDLAHPVMGTIVSVGMSVMYQMRWRNICAHAQSQFWAVKTNL